MWKMYNPNPAGLIVGDCAVRALCAALGLEWSEAYARLVVAGMELRDLPNANHVWGRVLREHGFKRRALPDRCPDCYTVADFAADHPSGIYVLAVPNHVVTVKNGSYYDTWDSGHTVPAYYWTTEEE